MFAELKKLPKLKSTQTDMPFTPLAEVRESTKLMSLDTWLSLQIKGRAERFKQHPEWSKEKREGYEQGIVDMALDVKNELKRLGK